LIVDAAIFLKIEFVSGLKRNLFVVTATDIVEFLCIFCRAKLSSDC